MRAPTLSTTAISTYGRAGNPDPEPCELRRRKKRRAGEGGWFNVPELLRTIPHRLQPRPCMPSTASQRMRGGTSRPWERQDVPQCWVLAPRRHIHHVYGIGGGCPPPDCTESDVRDTRHCNPRGGGEEVG